MARVILAKGRERPFVGRHPWVFAGAVDRVEGSPAPGDPVTVVAHDGSFVATGLHNPQSAIRVRLYSWQPDEVLDAGFWHRRVAEAVAVRSRLGLLDPAGACRLVFSEADGLTGLTADRYGQHLAVQFTSLALWAHRDALLDGLEAALAPSGGIRGIVLRTGKGVLEEEGLEASDGPLRGEVPETPVTYVENGFHWQVDLRTGQKTGAYLDQRDNRARVAQLAEGRRVADVCCYTGGFSLPMLAAGAESVVAVDASQRVLALADDTARRNGFGADLDSGRLSFLAGDAFRWLEAQREAGERYGMIVLDPPRFARSTRGVAQALRGYAGLNELAVDCLEPGGVLVTCSCTGRVSREQFERVLAGVEERTGRRIRILESRGQPADHPVAPTCPETAYLKCVVCTVE